MAFTTLHYRLKGSTAAKRLSSKSSSVNYVWNYCNETAYKALRNHGRWLSGFDLNYLTAGCSKELNLNSATIQSICEEYALRRKQFKKRKLKWRTKKSLGWIPFKGNGIKYKDGSFVYMGFHYTFFDSKYKLFQCFDRKRRGNPI